MLKSKVITLEGKDAGLRLRLHELPALAADRLARAALARLDADEGGGIVALAMQHAPALRALGPEALELLMPLVDGQVIAGGDAPRALDVTRDLRDWRNVERLQQHALMLHVGFILSRKPLELPVSFRAGALLQDNADVAVTWCSPFIAAIVQSKLATYRELETVLSTEDAYNLVEVLNVQALRDWQESQRNK